MMINGNRSGSLKLCRRRQTALTGTPRGAEGAAMSHQRVVLCIMLLDGRYGPAGCRPARILPRRVTSWPAFVVSYLCFLWYRCDSDARGYRRSRWLSAGVVAFTVATIPYYLVRSRRDGERGPALLTYAAYLAARRFCGVGRHGHPDRFGVMPAAACIHAI